MDQPLRRPTARLRHALGLLQVYLGAGVVLAAVAIGHLVQLQVDSRPPGPAPVARPQTDRPGPAVAAEATAPTGAGVTGSGAVGDGALAAIGVLIVGGTLVASAGTVGRRRIDEQESARWAADWKWIEPVWSGRVPGEF